MNQGNRTQDWIFFRKIGYKDFLPQSTSMKTTILLLLGLSSFFVVKAQTANKIKFGDVTEKDFAPKVYSVDSSASAVILSDIGSSKIEGNSKGWFSLVFKRHTRIHILNKNGYEMSNVSISLYSDGDDEEVLDKVKATTYNLENGKVVENKLDVKGNIFKDKVSKNWLVKKFTLPNVKEGSIIEYEYSITSDFLNNLQPWTYQGSYPRLWSEYNVALPDFLGYVFLTQWYKQYDIQDKKERNETFNIIDTRSSFNSDKYTITSMVTDYKWVMKDVKPLKEESFTSSIDNHTAKIEFQLSEYRRPLTEKKLIESWPTVASNLMKASYFGEQLTTGTGWLKDIIEPLSKGASGKKELAHRMYNWVRDNFTCTDHTAFTLDQTLKNLVKTRKGSVAEINLLLTAMLKHEDIIAAPVILSTRSNGKVYSIYPLLSQYNYVVTLAMVDGNAVFMDASEPLLGYGRLPLRCYNEEARVINETANVISLSANTVAEVKHTNVFVVNDEKGNIIGSKIQTPGYYESMNLRERVKEKGKEQLLADIKKEMGTDIDVTNLELDSLSLTDEVLGVKYDFELKGEKEDIIYFNPMLGEGYKENLFKSAERAYPVEMPFTMDEVYNLQMDIPQGYVVDELPKSMILKLNEENEGVFEYRISMSGNSISFRSRIRIGRANFQPDEYEMLREFFNYVVKKHAEQIVFKKKS